MKKLLFLLAFLPSLAFASTPLGTVNSNTSILLDTGTLQSGATFYVSSGTVNGAFHVLNGNSVYDFNNGGSVFTDSSEGNILDLRDSKAHGCCNSFKVNAEGLSAGGSYTTWMTHTFNSNSEAVAVAGTTVLTMGGGLDKAILLPTNYEINYGGNQETTQSFEASPSPGILRILLDNNSTSHSMLIADGNLEVGSISDTTPAYKLDVNGVVRSTGAIVTSFGSGVVQSDANGNLSSSVLSAANGSVIGSTVPIGINYDGGGSAIVAGSTRSVTVPFACVISSWTVVADQSGSLSLHVSSSTYANYPTLSNIVGSGNGPSLSSAQKNAATPSSWNTTTIPAGTVLSFVLDSASTVTWANVILWCVKN